MIPSKSINLTIKDDKELALIRSSYLQGEKKQEWIRNKKKQIKINGDS